MQKDKNKHLKYLVANAADESWGLFITTIGFQSIQANTPYPPKNHPSSYLFRTEAGRRLNEFQLIYITEGEGVFESTSCEPLKITAGTIIFLFPNEWHTYKPDKKTGWQEYWIGYKGIFIENLEKNQFISKKNPVIHVGFHEQIITLFKQGIEIASMQKPAYQQMLAGITLHMISYISYIHKNNAFRDKGAVLLIEKARMLMRENPEGMDSPKIIADKLNMSYSWFRRTFKHYTGLSPAQYMLEIKIQKSKELLIGTNMSIKEIAYVLKFLNVSYFVTFFKAKTGLRPGDYRNQGHSQK